MYLGGTVIYMCDSVIMIYKHVCTCACLVTNIGSLSGYTHHSPILSAKEVHANQARDNQEQPNECQERS